MTKLGLIGKDIAHSRSKDIYENLLNREIEYTLFDYSSEKELPDLEFLFNQVEGVSITAPYKKFYADKLNIVGEVSELGIINCIRKNNDIYEATNTDYLAVENFIMNYPSLDKYEFVLLGDGSMAEITKFLFSKKGLDYLQLSRKITPSFSNLNLRDLKFKQNKIPFVINSCSRKYIYESDLPEEMVFWDYNYSHLGHSNGIKGSNIQYIDGMGLLESQAKYALEFWGI